MLDSWRRERSISMGLSFFGVYVYMVIKLLNGWNNYNLGDILDLPDWIALEVISFNIGYQYLQGFPEFRLTDVNSANKESEHLWISLKENDWSEE